LKHLKSDQENLALSFMQRALAVLSILLIVSSIVGSVFALEISKLLFERGNFTHEDSIITAYVLIAYLIGLLPFGLQKLFSLWLYAKFKQKTAAFIAFKALLISALCSVLFIFLIKDESLKVIAVALSSSLSAFYLLIANIKEFGFKNFFALISFKFCFLMITGLVVFTILLYEIKPYLIEALLWIVASVKGVF
ncbi:lipid II flippase MurJ, partial [Campylobacter coli]